MLRAMRSQTAVRLCSILFAVALTTTACGGDQGSASSAPTTSSSRTAASAPSSASPGSPICADVAALKASSAQLRGTHVQRGQLSTVLQELSQLTSDLTQLKDDSVSEYATNIDAIQQAANSLRSSLTAAS